MRLKEMTMKGYVAIFLIGMVASPVFASDPCPYDPDTLSFRGAPSAQAACLLRTVSQWAKVEKSPVVLPEILAGRVGKEIVLTTSQLRSYLALHQIEENDIGGNLDAPVSRANPNKKGLFSAKYFVIHDTSTPNYRKANFPLDINSAAWKYNDLAGWKQGDESKAHVFVNRLGHSVTAVSFEQGWRATKFELDYSKYYQGSPATAVRGRFLHIELVQPRRSAKPAGSDDAIAPEPGFTDAQYRRLALLYVAASIRAGEWLIPAYHAVLDLGLKGAHDDPQNFQHSRWVEELKNLLKELEA